jgi:hypothetical protein
MEPFMRDNSKTGRCMARVFFIIIQANQLMMVCGLKISFMAKEFFIMNVQLF